MMSDPPTEIVNTAIYSCGREEKRMTIPIRSKNTALMYVFRAPIAVMCTFSGIDTIRWMLFVTIFLTAE